MRFTIAIVIAVLAAGVAHATPAIVRPGANHHLGDDSFVARFGRAPTAADSEALRMHVHLTYVRELLGAHVATSPSLEARRTQLLGYLDEYIAKGTTPRNTYVPQRNPVFIDRDGTICAVGYLIERSEGRALAESIASTHRLDYLEDIAAAMPEVAAWVQGSGLTLDELASIQPGYPGPDVMHLTGWLAANETADDFQPPLGSALPADGAFHDAKKGLSIDGAFTKGQMTGTWTVKREGKLLGRGVFEHGAATWTSFRADGTKLAEGTFAKSHATGTWRFYHPSGRLAATGRMSHGARDGRWTFFYDADGKHKLSVGRFKSGETLGPWRHYALDGSLVATATGRAWQSLRLNVEPRADGVRRRIHEGIPADGYRLDGFLKGKDRLYVRESGEMYDGRSMQVAKTDTGWVESACDWSKAARGAARRGDVNALHERLMNGGEGACADAAVKMTKQRAAHYDVLLASRDVTHGDLPVFDIDPAPPAPPPAPAADAAKDAPESSETTPDEPTSPFAGADDLASYLADHMTWYIEWPHVDGSFMAVYETLPGYLQHFSWEHDGDDASDE